MAKTTVDYGVLQNDSQSEHIKSDCESVTIHIDWQIRV